MCTHTRVIAYVCIRTHAHTHSHHPPSHAAPYTPTHKHTHTPTDKEKEKSKTGKNNLTEAPGGKQVPVAEAMEKLVPEVHDSIYLIYNKQK